MIPPQIRLYDLIMAKRRPLVPHDATFVSPGAWAAHEQMLYQELAQCERIVADSIDEFAVQNFSLDGGDFLIDSYQLPNIVPPFETMWIEWAMADPHSRRQGMRMAGALVESANLAEIGHGLHMQFFIDFQRQIIDQLTDVVLIHSTWEEGQISDIQVLKDHRVIGRQGVSVQMQQSLAPVLATSALLAISFMNCRNVTMPWVEPPEKLSRSFARRTGTSLATYRTIDITPMTKFVSDAQAAHQPQHRGRVAFQTIRGHFKRYANTGLFGKHRGTFFFSSHDRGWRERKTRHAGYAINLKGITPK